MPRNSRTIYSPPDPKDEQIRRLESDLYLARCAILRLASKEFQEQLTSYRKCKSRSDTYGWIKEVAEHVAQNAEPIESESFLGQERAYCPLCGDGVSNGYQKGFGLPVGLERHLIGWGNIRRCDVMEAAFRLAHDSWDSSFIPAEKEAEAEKDALKVKRFATETVYVVELLGKPLLLDDLGWMMFKPARSLDGDGPEGIKWAEQRLFALGFQFNVDGRIRSYTKSFADAGENYEVYADPREVGAIRFKVFKISSVRARSSKRPLGTFDIRDKWKNDLSVKFESHVKQCIG